jgi:hypothetical protein
VKGPAYRYRQTIPLAAISVAEGSYKHEDTTQISENSDAWLRLITCWSAFRPAHT